MVEKPQSGSGFWLQWTVVNVIASTVIPVATFLLYESHFGGYQRIPAFGVMGLGVGFLQWLVLQQRFSRAGWWILATAVPWWLAEETQTVPLAYIGTPPSLGPLLVLYLGVPASLALLLVLQWLVLRRQFRQDGWRILRSSVIFAVFTIVVFMFVALIFTPR